MEATAVYSSKGSPFLFSSRITTKKSSQNSATFSPFLIQSMATQKPLPSVAKTVGSRKVSFFLNSISSGFSLVVSMAEFELSYVDVFALCLFG